MCCKFWSDFQLTLHWKSDASRWFLWRFFVGSMDVNHKHKTLVVGSFVGCVIKWGKLTAFTINECPVCCLLPFTREVIRGFCARIKFACASVDNFMLQMHYWDVLLYNFSFDIGFSIWFSINWLTWWKAGTWNVLHSFCGVYGIEIDCSDLGFKTCNASSFCILSACTVFCSGLCRILLAEVHE